MALSDIVKKLTKSTASSAVGIGKEVWAGLQGGGARGLLGDAATGLADILNRNNQTDSNPPSSPYTPSYYGGYGAYSSGKTPGEVQEETQQQIENLAANTGQRAADLGDIAKDSLDTIKTNIQNSEDSYKYGMQQANMISAWQPNQQRETSTYRALRNRMGNAAYGSGLADLNEGMARVDDMNDVELINTYKENISGLWDNYRNALASLQTDYADQVNAIKDEFSKLSSQYWSSLSNISPKLATQENFDKAANGESVTVGEGTDAYTLPATNIKPSAELQELMVRLQMPDAFNPLTGHYVRPDRAVNAANAISNTGNGNKVSAAHRAFGDEMDAYRRRV